MINPFLTSKELLTEGRPLPRHLSGGNINQKPQKIQNKPNSCPFWAKNSDCTKKQTQFKPKTNPIYAGQATKKRLRNYEI